MPQTITLKQVYQELKDIQRNMLTKNELNIVMETVEILSNENTVKQIKKSEEDIKLGRVKEINSASDI